MVKPIVKDIFTLVQPCEPATPMDVNGAAKDLLDTFLDNGKVTGTGSLLGCQVIQAGGKTWDKLADLLPGDVCVWDSNLAIYAGNGKWYDAGGPFSANTKGGRYTNVGPVAPYYDRTKPIYYQVRAKV